ncbi:MAG: N-acetylcysteine deacetylase [Desulfovibrio sp.]
MDELLRWLDDHSQELLSVYEQFHANPELGFQEHQTAAFLAEELRKAGYDVQDTIGDAITPVGTGIVGTLKGSEPGPVLALRADMDALPITEETGLPYASKNAGVMHACGHDAHSAMLLFAARAIAATGGIKRGTLKIVFQPAEETLRGARALIASGALADVDEIVGIHVRNNSEALVGQATCGVCHGAAWHVKAKVHGKAAHAAWYHRGVNVVDAVAAIVNAVNAVHGDPNIGHSVKVTQCNTGAGAVNIIPELAEIACDLRAQTNEVMAVLQEKTKNAIEMGAATVGATVTFDIIGGVPAASFDPALVAAVKESIAAVLGEENTLPPVISPGSEDFHCFSVEGGMKTAFIGIGADMGTGGHTSTMCIDTSILPNGSKVFAHLVAAKLR